MWKDSWFPVHALGTWPAVVRRVYLDELQILELSCNISFLLQRACDVSKLPLLQLRTAGGMYRAE